MSEPRRYGLIVGLETVDRNGASFEHMDPSGGPSMGGLYLARAVWEQLGRPGELLVSITPPEVTP